MNHLWRPISGRLLRQTQQQVVRFTNPRISRHNSAEVCQAQWPQGALAVACDSQEDTRASLTHVQLTAEENAKPPNSLDLRSRLDFRGTINNLTLEVSRLPLKRRFNGRIDGIDHLLELLEDQGDRQLVAERLQWTLSSFDIMPDVWIAWLNILRVCRDWDECMAELVRGTEASGGQSARVALLDVDNWPSCVLLHAVDLIRTPSQARDAIEIVRQRGHRLSTDSYRLILKRLDRTALIKLQAYHLGHSLSRLHLSYADRLLSADGRTDEMSVQVHVYIAISSHLDTLKYWRDDRARALAMQVIEWADVRLDQDFVDRMRMRLLSVGQRRLTYAQRQSIRVEDGVQRKWQDCDWSIPAELPFSDSKMATELLRGLHKNGRHGIGFTLALRRAMQIAARDRNSDESRELQIVIRTYIQEEEKIDKEALHGAETLQFLIKEGREQEVWTIFRHLSRKKSWNASRCELALIIEWLAAKDDVPLHYTLSLADVDEEATEGGNTPLYHDPGICSALLVGLNRRSGQDAYVYVLKVWRAIVRHKVRIDARCLASICQAMTQAGEVERSAGLLEAALKEGNTETTCSTDEEMQVAEGVTPTLELFHHLMLTSIAQGDSMRVYNLFKKIEAHGDLESNARSLGLLLRAAHDVSKYAYDDDRSHPMISAIFSRLTSRSRETHYLDGLVWDGEAAALKARQIFLDRLYAQHPELEHLPLPIDSSIISGNLLFRNEVRLRNGSTWLRGVKETLPGARNDGDSTTDVLQGVYCTFTGWTFHRYLLLLPYAEEAAARSSHHPNIAWEERLAVLSWMRALDIKPAKFTLCLLCNQLDEVLPPAADYVSYKAAGRRKHENREQWAAGPLNEYLAEWLGEDNVPTYSDVIKALSSKNALAGGSGGRN